MSRNCHCTSECLFNTPRSRGVDFDAQRTSGGTRYCMTPEYGAETQLEKIDMLHHADLVVVNKCDRRGGEDALRAVRKQAPPGEGRQLVGETCPHGSVSTTSPTTFFLPSPRALSPFRGFW